MLASLATPLVLSVHSVVSFDFAVSIMPGWHTTIFPPYFVAGAIFSGFAMVTTLIIPTRKLFHLEEIITKRHLENMAKIMLATGMMVGLAYSTEFFVAWYSGNQFEAFTFLNRAFGPYAWAYWTMVTCNVVVPQVFWFRKLRNNTLILWIASVLINVGMWFERFVIVVSSLSRDYLPTSWGYYRPTDRRRPDLRRQLRAVLHAVPVVHPLPAADRHGGGQGCDAAGPPRPSGSPRPR